MSASASCFNPGKRRRWSWMYPSASRASAARGAQFQTGIYVGGAERWLPPDQFVWLDWERLYLDMLEFKEERGFHNLLIRPEHPREILAAEEPKLYGLVCDESLLKPTRTEHAMRLANRHGRRAEEICREFLPQTATAVGFVEDGLCATEKGRREFPGLRRQSAQERQGT